MACERVNRSAGAFGAGAPKNFPLAFWCDFGND